MEDQYGRRLRYLRVSLTDRCNFRCVYCMPIHAQFYRLDEVLSDAELLLIIRAAASLGVEKIRLTGGEPTLRRNLPDLVRAIAQIPGIRDLSMTTNGVRLPRLARALKEAGLQRVNVSIDTLDEEKFRRLRIFGELCEVFAGLDAAQEAGLSPIKINCVVVRGVNDRQDVIDLAGLTYAHDWEVRFIEMMPFAEVAEFNQEKLVPTRESMACLESAYGPLEPVSVEGFDPARTYRLPGAQGLVGFISTVSEPFCARCGRLRLTADGKLRLCLLKDEEVDLMTPLRRGASFEDVQRIIYEGAYHKPWGHDLSIGVFPQQRVMSKIGG
ncbi:MAG: GTP 3',8-cyclase MoaA [Chloroflexi bacterium]|nr:GTP 3',8-cyclase MoaA [Chloroflexota bacterium]